MESVNNLMMNVAEIELVYKSKVKASARLKIASSKDVYNVLIQSWDDGKIEFIEQFKVLLMNRANKILGLYEVSSGGVTGTVADPRLIFTAALKANATAIILCHNHPSGNLQPSAQDNDLTSKISSAGKLLDIKVLDHLIISGDSYYSYADEGLL